MEKMNSEMNTCRAKRYPVRNAATNYHGWPVSAWVRCRATDKIGQVQAPYTCAGEDIIRAGKVIVSGFGEYGVLPDSIIPALGA